MQRDIVRSPIALRMPAVPATAADVQVAQDLLDTLAAHAAECVGLAANMIGERAAVIAFADGKRRRAMLNPEIVEASDPYETEEGCLSLSGVRPCTRYQRIRVRYQDEQLVWHQERFSGYTAEIIQHEIDHCHGVVI